MCSQILISHLAVADLQPAHQRHLHAAFHRHLDGSAKSDQLIAGPLGRDTIDDSSQDSLDCVRGPAEVLPHRYPRRT
ncbi:hypothetical protein D9M68_344110 [compost metagenome]